MEFSDPLIDQIPIQITDRISHNPWPEKGVSIKPRNKDRFSKIHFGLSQLINAQASVQGGEPGPSPAVWASKEFLPPPPHSLTCHQARVKLNHKQGE